MKRIAALSVLMCSLFIFAGCTGPNGNAHQKYWWAGSLGYIYDTNPSTPSIVRNDVYFSTNAGSYYMEYQAFDGSEWYVNYKITTKEGKLFNTAGDDSWFEIGLFSTGPELYEWDSARNIQNRSTQAYNTTPSISAYKTNTKISAGKRLGEVRGTLEREQENGSISIEYGRIIGN